MRSSFSNCRASFSWRTAARVNSREISLNLWMRAIRRHRRRRTECWPGRPGGPDPTPARARQSPHPAASAGPASAPTCAPHRESSKAAQVREEAPRLPNSPAMSIRLRPQGKLRPMSPRHLENPASELDYFSWKPESFQPPLAYLLTPMSVGNASVMFMHRISQHPFQKKKGPEKNPAPRLFWPVREDRVRRSASIPIALRAPLRSPARSSKLARRV